MQEQVAKQGEAIVEEPKNKRDHPIEQSATSGGDPNAGDPPPQGTPPRPPFGGPGDGEHESGDK